MLLPVTADRRMILRGESETDMNCPDDIPGTAALAICESLLLALNDHNILPEKEIVGILMDAAYAHSNAPQGDEDALHAAVADLINGIITGGNSVRRP
jgi:hypothetical protein